MWTIFILFNWFSVCWLWLRRDAKPHFWAFLWCALYMTSQSDKTTAGGDFLVIVSIAHKYFIS